MWMTVTRENDPTVMALARGSGATFIEKRRLLRLPSADVEQDLHNWLVSGQLRLSGEAENAVLEYVYRRGGYSDLEDVTSDDETAFTLAPNFTEREKDFVEIIRNDPEDRLTRAQIGEMMRTQKGPISDETVEEYQERVIKKGMILLGWFDPEDGKLTDRGWRKLGELGLLRGEKWENSRYLLRKILVALGLVDQ
jgi:hypothetical protein